MPEETLPPVTNTPPAPTMTSQAPAAPASKKKMLFIGGGILALVTIATLAFFLLPKDATKTALTTNATDTELIQPTLIPEASDKTKLGTPGALANVLVYGSWSGQSSLIKAVELSTNTLTILATLPSSIKKVSVLSPQTLLYIDQTDKRDHGKQLVLYDMKTKAAQATIPASTGFGIDDYVLSPDKKYVAIWEVSFAPNSEILYGGRSHVYAVDLRTPTAKKLLYDETANAPVHYPRAILNSGRVFADTFLPNDPNGGAGWAYGLSVVNFDGTGKQNLTQMQAGTYGTQPALSPDGKYLVFSGYDGSKGDGKAIEQGFRQAILTPNTLELLDTTTLARQKLTNVPNTAAYVSAAWNPESTAIITTALSAKKDQSGLFTYNLQANALQKVIIPDNGKTEYSYISDLKSQKMIVGIQDESASSLGNLGENYSQPYSRLYALETNTTKAIALNTEDALMQYITVLPHQYFGKVLGVKTIAQANTQDMKITKQEVVDLYSDENGSKDNVQIYTFIVKNTLEAIRTNQQTNPLQAISLSGIPNSPNTSPDDDDNLPKCRDLAAVQCTEQGLVGNPRSDAFDDCEDEGSDVLKDKGSCQDSPLYLYGPSGLQVAVNIQTPIANAIPSYKNGYDVTLREGGKMEINGNVYAKIAYDYQSNLKKITPPKTGVIVHKQDVAKALKDYAQKMGLNAKETADLVGAGNQKATGPYVFVSFFDQETSKQILPISFSPEPDNYFNVVFYFKNLPNKPNYTPLPPVFSEPVNRTGFTAVEISEFVE